MPSRSRVDAPNRSARAGVFVPQPGGHRAFLPAPLPPDPPLGADDQTLRLLARAALALGRLDGVVRIVPDPDFFVGMYVRREAVLSSQIEGTQSTLEDLLEAELEPRRDRVGDVGDIVNYVAAMNLGLARMHEIPLSLRLIREIHHELLKDGRGATATPGEFRQVQNWIGPPGAPIQQASFVPPPVPEMHAALHGFEAFLHDDSLPLLLQAGLAHAQFETIHPFLDGNGRVGRLLITLLLVRGHALRAPLLYLSHFLKQHRAEYYDRLTAIRADGDWEGWMRFFLTGVLVTSTEATETAERIFELRERHRAVAIDLGGTNGVRLLNALLRSPLTTVDRLAAALGVTYPTANRLIAKFEEAGVVREITGQKRHRRYRYDDYLRLFDDS